MSTHHIQISHPNFRQKKSCILPKYIVLKTLWNIGFGIGFVTSMATLAKCPFKIKVLTEHLVMAPYMNGEIL